MHALADLIARHALIALSITVIVMLTLAAVFWRFVTVYGPRTWSLVLALWNSIRQGRMAARLRGVPVIGRLLTGTFTVARYLGVVAVLGFVLALVAAVIFFELAQEIGAGESLAAFDEALRAALSAHVPRELLRVFAVVTRLGDSAFLIAVAVIVLAVLLARGSGLLAVVWAVATASGGLLNKLLKVIFERSRPLHDHGLLTETSWSFPSGHASGSVLIYGLLTYLVVRHTPSLWHIPTALAGMTLIIFVGSSRVLLQVHYLSDVLAGYVSAAAWVAVCIAALEAVRWRQARSANLAR